MTKGVIIASVVTGVLCAIGFIGIWFWYPRMFAWGNKMERKSRDEELAPEGSSPETIEAARAARLAMSRGINQRALAREQAIKRGEAPPAEEVVPASYYAGRGADAYPPLPAVHIEPSKRTEDGTEAPPAY